MKHLAIIIVAAVAALTVLSMAMEPQLETYALFTIGSHQINSFDVVIGGAIVFIFIRNGLHFSPDPIKSNRYVLWLCAMYFFYQVFIVFPIAVIGHGLRPIDVERQIEVRLAIVLVPLFYSIVLKYLKPSAIIAIFDVAATGLALWVFYRYVATGGAGYWDGDVYRLRAAWGGTTLVFGWLVFTSLFYWPLRSWRIPLAALGAGALLLVDHRSGILALVLALIVQVIAMRGVIKRAVVAFSTFLILGIGVLFASPFVRQSLAYSLSTLVNPNADPNAQDRVTRSLMGLAYFQHHLLGDYIWNQNYYLVNLGPNGFEPHNLVVQLLVTQGVVATILYLAPIAATFVLAWRNRATRLSSVMLAYLTFYIVFCLLNTNIDQIENVALLYVAMALVLDANRRRTGRQELLDQSRDTFVETRPLTGVYSRDGFAPRSGLPPATNR